MVLTLDKATAKTTDRFYFHKHKKALKSPKSTSRLNTRSDQVLKVKENLIFNSEEFSLNSEAHEV